MLNQTNSQICPYCGESGLRNSSVGLMCPSCGRIIHQQNQPSQSADEVSSDILEPMEDYSSSNFQIDNLDSHQPVEKVTANQEQFFSKPNENESNRPQIVNHHASSYYRKRLNRLQAELAVPELPAPDSEILLEAKNTSQLPTPKLSEKYQPNQTQLVNPLPPTQPENLTSEVSNLSPAEKAFLDQTKSSMVNNQPAKLDGITAVQPYSQADALLAAAKSPVKDTTHNLRNWLMIGGTVVLFLISGVVLVQSLLPSKSTTSMVSASPTPIVSKTPSTVQTTTGAKRDALRKEDLNSLAIGLEAYKKSTGSYPIGDSISALVPLTKTNPPYITKLPTDPITSENPDTASVNYGYSSDGSKFSLTAVLENKQDADGRDGLYTLRSR